MNKVLENLHWLGHSSFKLDSSKIIYFDPWKLPKNSPKADIILISHEHYDHCSLEDVKLISSKNTVIITNKDAALELEFVKAQVKEIKVLLPQDTMEVYGVTINAVFSYNIGKQFHTKLSDKLGFIVNVDGIKIYHAGDTDNIPEMKNYSADIALLPVSGTYVMTADEAAAAALKFKPKMGIPMHYGDIVGTSADAERFRDLLKGKIEVKILNKES